MKKIDRHAPPGAVSPLLPGLVALAFITAGVAQAQWVHSNHLHVGLSSWTIAADPANGKVVALDQQGFTRDLIYSTSGTTWGPQNIPYPTGIPVVGQLVTRGTGSNAVLTLVVASASLPIKVFVVVGGQWSPVATTNTPTLSPQVRSMPNGDLIAFGGPIPGPIGGVPSNATWRLSGTTWTLLTPSTSPSPRWEFGMTTNNTGVVVFGGSDAVRFLNDMWQFDGTNWSQFQFPTNSTNVPSPRVFPGLAFRPTTGEYTVTGGIDSTLTICLDSWHLNTSFNWVLTGTAIPWASGTCESAVEPIHNEVITVVGVSGPTSIDSVSGYNPFGQGCNCLGGGPAFTLTPDPYSPGAGIGGYNYVLPANYDPTRIPIFAWGTGPSIPVPLPGFPSGCNLLMSNIVAFDFSHGVTLPNDHLLRGLQLVYQMFQLPDTGFGGCVSNAIDVRIGF